MTFVSRAFRAALREELPRWAEEGIVTPEAAAVLRERYRLDEDGGAYATLAAYILGALLVGGGMMSFVAWNWAFLPTVVKLTGGIVALVATQVIGYYLWRVDGRRPWLGHAMVFLGLLLFGANLGLFAQAFNIYGHWQDAAGIWAIVGAAIALTTRSLPCALIAALLSVIWGVGQMEGTPRFSLLSLPIAYGVSAALVIATFRFKHGIMVAAAAGGATILLTVAGVYDTVREDELLALYFVPLAVCSILLAVSLFDTWASITARRLGLGGFVILAYLASFGAFGASVRDADVMGDAATFGLLLVTAPLEMAAMALFVARVRQPRPLTSSEVGAVISLVGLLSIMGAWSLSPLLIWLVAHVALIAFIGWSLRRANDDLERAHFWMAVTVGSAVIVTRFLEFETGLLFKAAVFTALGLGIIAVAYVFETRRRKVMTYAP